MSDTPSNTRPTLTVQELAELRSEGTPHLLLDVREPPELAICRIEQARHIPMGSLADHLDELPQDRPIVVMCHHGIRSGAVVDELHRIGFTSAVNLRGGIDAWAREIDPQMAVY